MKPDRRIQRTRQLLNQTLIQLIIEKGYEKITVQDILDRANCGRSTFYNHFNNKHDLLLSGFEAFGDVLPDSIFPLPKNKHDTTYIHFGQALIRHVEENRLLAKAMFGTEVWKMVWEHLHNTLVIYARKWVKHFVAAGANSVPAEITAQYLTSTLLGLITWWVNHDFPYTTDKMSAIFARLTMPGLK